MTKIRPRVATTGPAATAAAKDVKAAETTTDQRVAPKRNDRFESGGSAEPMRDNHPAITADEDLSSELSSRRALSNTGNIAHGRGVAAVPRKNHVAGVKHAKDYAETPMNYDNPEITLNDLSQVDADRRTKNDDTRCGPASIVAGLVLLGPEQMNTARMKMKGRMYWLSGNIEGKSGANIRSQTKALKQAKSLFEGLPADAKDWTVQDTQRFQEATYLTARVDEEQTVHGNFGADNKKPMKLDTGLGTPTAKTYRDYMWSGPNGNVNQPTYKTLDGKKHNVDIVFHGAHFVLGTGKVGKPDAASNVMFDPMPQVASKKGGTLPLRSDDDAGSAFTQVWDNSKNAPLSIPKPRGAPGVNDMDAMPNLADLNDAQKAVMRKSQRDSS